jgi:hypothetical protein
MFNFVETKRSAFAVFEPFLRGLVAADVEVPGFKRNIVKILLFVDKYLSVFARLFACIVGRQGGQVLLHRYFVTARNGKRGFIVGGADVFH